MAANTLRAITRHDSDDECSGDGNEHAVPAQMISGRRNHRSAPPPKVEKISEYSDQPKECKRDKRTDRPDQHGKCRNREHANRGGEVSELRVFLLLFQIFSIIE